MYGGAGERLISSGRNTVSVAVKEIESVYGTACMSKIIRR